VIQEALIYKKKRGTVGGGTLASPGAICQGEVLLLEKGNHQKKRTPTRWTVSLATKLQGGPANFAMGGGQESMLLTADWPSPWGEGNKKGVDHDGGNRRSPMRSGDWKSLMRVTFELTIGSGHLPKEKI